MPTEEILDQEITRETQKPQPEINLLKLKALSDVIRVEIVRMLATQPLCACDILAAFNISQPTLSYHMRLLTSSGLVDGERHGKWMHYTLNREAFSTLQTYIELIATPGNSPVVVHKSDCGDGRCAVEFQHDPPIHDTTTHETPADEDL